MIRKNKEKKTHTHTTLISLFTTLTLILPKWAAILSSGFHSASVARYSDDVAVPAKNS